ncbi:hypothetical protein ACWEPL_50080 [Nonomuraea sp. NPDC004186]
MTPEDATAWSPARLNTAFTASVIAYAGATPTGEGPAHHPAATAGHVVELADHYRPGNQILVSIPN